MATGKHKRGSVASGPHHPIRQLFRLVAFSSKLTPVIVLASLVYQQKLDAGDFRPSALFQAHNDDEDRNGDARATEISINADCNNDGLLDLTDFRLFTLFWEGPMEGSAGGCRC